MYFQFGKTRIAVNVSTRDQLLNEVRSRLRVKAGFSLATLNLDHIVKMKQQESFLKAYKAQDLVVADGNPIVWLSRLAGQPVELMPGSDLILPLAQLAAEEGRSLALLGSSPEALNDARAWFAREVPGLEIVAMISPPMGFDPDSAEADRLLQEVAASGAGLCFIALGAPKQERLAARARDIAPHTGFASIGAGLDFLGGRQKRAPLWVRRIAMEWAWRLCSSPKRLARRYFDCAMALPGLVLQTWFVPKVQPVAPLPAAITGSYTTSYPLSVTYTQSAWSEIPASVPVDIQRLPVPRAGVRAP